MAWPGRRVRKKHVRQLAAKQRWQGKLGEMVPEEAVQEEWDRGLRWQRGVEYMGSTTGVVVCTTV